MTKRLLVNDDVHRIAKAKAAAAGQLLHEWLEQLIRRAPARDLGDPRPSPRPRSKRAG